MPRFTLNPNSAPDLSEAQRDRLDTMTEADIKAAAEADADNPPLSDIELSKVRSARVVRQARLRSGLSQAGFAKMYHINVARLRDLEQGRTQADSALLAYLTVIEREPEIVRRALEKLAAGDRRRSSAKGFRTPFSGQGFANAAQVRGAIGSGHAAEILRRAPTAYSVADAKLGIDQHHGRVRQATLGGHRGQPPSRPEA
jgi:putative transcriptional regulator